MLGVVGMDISLDTLQKLAANLGQDLYRGDSQVTILSATGQVAGRSGAVSGTRWIYASPYRRRRARRPGNWKSRFRRPGAGVCPADAERTGRQKS